MFTPKSRQELEALAATLRNWEHSVPPEARGFHRLRRQVLDDIGQHLARRFWIDRAFAAECRVRYEILDGLAPNLGELAAKVRGLESELGALLEKLENLPVPHGAVQARCDEWRQALHRLPADCEQAVDLARAGKEADRIEGELRSHAEALDWLDRAGRILKTLGASADTAALAAELPELRESFVAGEDLERVVRRLRTLCPPLEAQTRKSPPPELHRLGALLADLRGWDRKLNGEEGDPRVAELSRRHQRLRQDWRRSPDEFQDLSLETAELRDELTERAGEIRTGQAAELEDLLADLEWAAGPQPEIHAALERLKDFPVERHQDHEEWLVELVNAGERFKSVAGSRSPVLEQRLGERRTALAERLHALLALSLSEDAREEAEALAAEAEALSGLESGGDLPRALRRSSGLQRRLEALELDARAALRQLSETQLRLNERNRWLQAEARPLGFAGRDLSEPIAALTMEGPAHRTLDQARGLAAALEAELAAQERSCLDHCRTLLERWAQDSAPLLDALAAAGRPESPAASILPAAIPAFREAPRLLAEAEAEYRRLEGRVEAAAMAAEAAREKLLARLSALDSRTLDPADRDAADALREPLAALPDEAGAAERLLSLSAHLAAAESFLQRLSAEREGLQRRLDRLKARLRAFNREGLKAFCPEDLIHRVADLAYGVPAPPGPAHLPQLKQAEAWFDRIEAEARRAAADSVAQGLASLRRSAHRHPDPGSLADLCRRIEGLGHEQVVPARLREELRQAVARAGEGTADGTL